MLERFRGIIERMIYLWFLLVRRLFGWNILFLSVIVGVWMFLLKVICWIIIWVKN